MLRLCTNYGGQIEINNKCGIQKRPKTIKKRGTFEIFYCTKTAQRPTDRSRKVGGGLFRVSRPTRQFPTLTIFHPSSSSSFSPFIPLLLPLPLSRMNRVLIRVLIGQSDPSSSGIGIPNGVESGFCFCLRQQIGASRGSSGTLSQFPAFLPERLT